MLALLNVLQIVAGIGSLVCLIMVIIKMFQRGETTIGVVTLVLLLLCGLGSLLAFVYGWIKAAEWNITNLMLIWTGCVVVGIVLSLLTYGMNPAM